MVDNTKLKKLQANLNWAQVLKEDKVIIKIFCIVFYGIFLYKIDIKNKFFVIYSV